MMVIATLLQGRHRRGRSTGAERGPVGLYPETRPHAFALAPFEGSDPEENI